MANCNAENGILGPHPCPDQEDHGPPLQCQRGKQGPQQEQQQPVQNQYSMLFAVMGWYKIGTINDIVLVDPNSSGGGHAFSGNNNQGNQVAASDVNYRIVELLPTNQRLLDLNSALGSALYHRKFNVTKSHGVEVVYQPECFTSISIRIIDKQ